MQHNNAGDLDWAGVSDELLVVQGGANVNGRF